MMQLTPFMAFLWQQFYLLLFISLMYQWPIHTVLKWILLKHTTSGIFCGLMTILKVLFIFCWVFSPFLLPFHRHEKRCNLLRVGSWLSRLTLQQTEATHWSTKAWLASLPLLLLSTLSILCKFAFLSLRNSCKIFLCLRICSAWLIGLILSFFKVKLILTLYRSSTSVWTTMHCWLCLNCWEGGRD